MKKILCVCLFLFFFAPVFSQNVHELVLYSGWQFRKAGDKNWLPATVPGTVHTDLLANKVIADPFFGTNEKKLQWIDTCDWEYRLLFNCPPEIARDSNAYLLFEGLDTYADVYLNHTLLISTDNMFREWKITLRGNLKNTGNELRILFHSAVTKGKQLARQLPYTLPGGEQVFTRKAPYHYGWDWGPRFVTCGIWKNVHIVSFEKSKIENVFARQTYLSDTLAILNIEVEVNCKIPGKYNLQISCMPADTSGIATPNIQSEPKIFQKGTQRVGIKCKIRNPVRWWCNTLGKPHLYELRCRLSQNQHTLDTRKFKIGLRTIELVQEKDSIGKSFYFKLNGVPVFVKGANYIPRDNFLTRKTGLNEKQIIDAAVESNMNMLRVWGGGVYENESFYEECDQRGILVWQDFIFACAMYPGDSAFIKNVRQEIIENITRIRNHPCIALWCGNNEIDEGWHNWEWQKSLGYSIQDSAKIWYDYKNLFENLLPGLVSELDPPIPYWPSSPSIGWGHKESLLNGDSHYWGVWWGMEPFETYTQKVGRFMSEYGFQGMPPLSTFKKIAADTSLYLNSASVKNHQKHPTGYETIQKYLERDYIQPKDFENYIYVSQLLQAEGMKTAMEAHRRAKPYCMGSLYWQLNDCWPVTSWSSMDYYGNRKALFYFAKQAFKETIISFEEKKDSLFVFVVSDSKEPVSGALQVQALDFTGKVSTHQEQAVRIPKNSSVCYAAFSIRKITNNYSDTGSTVFTATLAIGKETISAYHYFTKPKNLELKKPELKISAIPSPKGQCFSIKTNVMAKNVFITVKGESINLSDNFFDLLPGEEKIVFLPPGKEIPDLEKKITLKTLTDTHL